MTSGAADTPRSGRLPAVGEVAWHTLGADQVLQSEGVDGQGGLSLLFNPCCLGRPELFVLPGVS